MDKRTLILPTLAAFGLLTGCAAVKPVVQSPAYEMGVVKEVELNDKTYLCVAGDSPSSNHHMARKLALKEAQFHLSEATYLERDEVEDADLSVKYSMSADGTMIAQVCMEKPPELIPGNKGLPEGELLIPPELAEPIVPKAPDLELVVPLEELCGIGVGDTVKEARENSYENLGTKLEVLGARKYFNHTPPKTTFWKGKGLMHAKTCVLPKQRYNKQR